MAAPGAPENPAMDIIPKVAQQVFDIDLLREMILNHAIRRDNGEVCGSNVSSLRLVQKSWLETITKVLQKSKEPLFKLVLDEGNSLMENVREEGKLLDRFLNTIATKPSLPTFSVKILEQVFAQENHSSLSKMLVQFGGGLVQLDLHIPQCGGTLNLLFPMFSLQSVGRLRVTLSEWELPGTGATGRKSNANVSHFLNFLLNAAPALTGVVVSILSFNDPADPVPFQFFTLPPSITRLKLLCLMSSENLELLVKNDLPNLNSLTLRIPVHEAYPEGLLFLILGNFRKTLRQLTLVGCLWTVPRVVTNLRFPVMEKLEEFTNYSTTCELETGLHSLQKFLPKLHRLVLVHQTADMVRKWTENSSFANVNGLWITDMINERVQYPQPECIVGADLEWMRGIRRTFPNVRALYVNINPTQVCALTYLFMEMRQLRSLSIVVVGNTVGFGWDFWDGLFIGAPAEFVAGLRKSPRQFWEHVQLANDALPSIQNLQELTSLYLETNSYFCRTLITTGPFISDLTFLLALFKMPKLKYLNLKGKFKASDEMAETWRTQGRRLVYYDIQ